MTLFKTPTPEEEASFREWARQNYKPYTSISGLWHPVIQAECTRINTTHELAFPDLSEEVEDTR